MTLPSSTLEDASWLPSSGVTMVFEVIDRVKPTFRSSQSPIQTRHRRTTANVTCARERAAEGVLLVDPATE